MRFGLVHRIMTDTLAALGILALVTSGKLHPAVALVVLIGLVFGILLPERYRQQALVQVGGVAGPLIVLAIQVGRLALGGDPIPIVVEFAAALQVIRLMTRRGAAHDHQIILLSLLHLISGTVLGGGLTYAVALMGFLVFTPGALVLSHLRREVEGNYRQGARDRTGMPVDVPRILRSRRVIGKGFLLFTCSLSLPVFLFSALLFMVFPRVGFAWLAVPPISPSRVVGFSNRVDLGGVGTIRTDPTLVMRVRPDSLSAVTDPPRRRNFYLRGAVFDTYSRGSWQRLGSPSFRAQELSEEIHLRRPPRPTDRVMRIDLDRIEPPVVFVPGEAVSLKVQSGSPRPMGARPIVTMNGSGQLEYSSLEQQGLTYDVFLPKEGLIYPEREHVHGLERYLKLPRDLSPRVRSLAEDLTRHQDQPLLIARALEKALREGYTYDLGSPSGAAEDPLDHFLFVSKRGHCEFYSTAMALMLRVRGVPSRNVTGFVGGTLNRFSGFYAVRQADAHYRVEAYLPERGWIRFDPTPPSSARPQAIAQGMNAWLREAFEAASQSWRQNVEGFDLRKQIRILRRLERAFSRDNENTPSSGVLARLGTKRKLSIALGLILVGLAVYAFRKTKREAPPRLSPELTASIQRSIELYRLLEQALALRGVPRPLSTPPLTHALALRSAGHPTGEEAVILTRLYLRARFGRRRLTEAEAQDFEIRAKALRISEAKAA